MTGPNQALEYGNFSVSLNVKDLQASFDFYQKLGFTQIAGDMEQNYLILSNGSSFVGLFHGMFDKNIMTYNPLDVRALCKKLKERGIEFETEPQGESGPTHAVLYDPDGNQILLDQH